MHTILFRTERKEQRMWREVQRCRGKQGQKLESHSLAENRVSGARCTRFFSARNRKFWDFTVWFGSLHRSPVYCILQRCAKWTDVLMVLNRSPVKASNVFQARLGEEGRNNRLTRPRYTKTLRIQDYTSNIQGILWSTLNSLAMELQDWMYAAVFGCLDSSIRAETRSFSLIGLMHQTIIKQRFTMIV